MKKQYVYITLIILLLSLSLPSQAQRRWDKDGRYEKVDTVLSIPKDKPSNNIFIDEDEFYLKLSLFGLGMEIESDDDDDWRYRRRSRRIEYYERHDHGTLKSLNFEMGLNNFLIDGEFPSSADLYQVKPANSVYVGLNWTRTSYVSGPLFLEWGGGLSWYNYKFENAATRLDPNGNELNFVQDMTVSSALKSKLKVTYLNFTAVPMLDLGGGKRIVRTYEDGDVRIAYSARRGFRIGLGGYAGLRLGNKAKYIYKTGGDRERSKDKGGFFINDFRYGARLQVGINSFDMFFNYDMNRLFEKGKGPALHPISFGVIF